ncbi:MAG: YitT family protein [Flavobacterium sp.]|nr:YitT family protein [Pedobacter sp.]
MQFSAIHSFIINKLWLELPVSLTYHNVAHTEKVVEAAMLIAGDEGLNEEDRIILTTAALFHDTGFINGPEKHEERSCQLAREFLPSHEYSDQQIDEICRLIMATKTPCKPKDHLEEIMCDADLAYLGTDTFVTVSAHLYQEMKHLKNVTEIEGWPETQIQFLRDHQFFTQSAIVRYANKKEANFSNLLKNYKPALNGTIHRDSGFFIQDYFLIVTGVIIAGFALKGFLVPNNFFDGGITGISLLLHELYHFNLAYIIVIANIPFIVLSYFGVNLKFAVKTFFCVILLAVCLLYFPYPIITTDKLLISIFGGFFLGIGVGLTMRAGCALDGVEILALFTIKKTSFTITEIILAINVLIFSVAALRFGMETALYSILTYFTASKTVDYVIEGIEAYTGVTIISGQSDLMKERLVNQLGRGITVYKGERGFLPGNFHQSSNCDIIFTVVTRLEMRKLKNLVAETDPKAFVFASTIKEATGGILRRRVSH